MARSLAQKHYYLMVRPIIEKNLKTLNRLIEGYKENGIEEAFDSLSEE